MVCGRIECSEINGINRITELSPVVIPKNIVIPDSAINITGRAFQEGLCEYFKRRAVSNLVWWDNSGQWRRVWLRVCLGNGIKRRCNSDSASNMQSRSFSSIFEMNCEKNIGGFRVGNANALIKWSYPRSFVSPHFIKLTLHDFQLLPIQFNGFFGFLACCSHLFPLIANEECNCDTTSKRGALNDFDDPFKIIPLCKIFHFFPLVSLTI